jgi:hypothetical protein
MDGVLLTFLCGIIFICGPLFLLSIILMIKYSTEGNWSQFYEFLFGFVISAILGVASFILGGYYRSKTKDYNDPKDKTWFDSFIPKK